MLTGQGQLGGTTSTKYYLLVISAGGRIVRSATAGIQSAGWHFPRFSVAGHSVYFLDGDRDLSVLRSDGSVRQVGQLPGGPADRVIFAVSPDEQQIAYSVLHYWSGGTTSTSLRVGPLASLDAHEIFSGSPVEFPIGWLSDRLVIAVAAHATIQNPGEVNPYFADAYHVVDAVTANRTYSTSPTCLDPQGPVNAAGTICQQGSNLLALDWKGAGRQLGSAGTLPPAVLNPDGQSVAIIGGANNRITIQSGTTSKPTAAVGTPAGWFDSDHLLFMTGQDLSPVAVLEVKTGRVIQVASGPAGSTDPYAPFFVPIPNSLV
jgi:hypothetical protein